MHSLIRATLLTYLFFEHSLVELPLPQKHWEELPEVVSDIELLECKILGRLNTCITKADKIVKQCCDCHIQQTHGDQGSLVQHQLPWPLWPIFLQIWHSKALSEAEVWWPSLYRRDLCPRVICVTMNLLRLTVGPGVSTCDYSPYQSLTRTLRSLKPYERAITCVVLCIAIESRS